LVSYSDDEIESTVRGLIEKYGPDALAQADKMLRNVIPERDQETIQYWRDVIKALGKKR
jgi:hypothetical protein